MKGHQDEVHRPLSFLETLNVRMDDLAKRRRIALETAPFTVSPLYRLPHEKWQLCLGVYKICRDVDKQICHHISEDQMRAYWSKTRERGGRQFDDVDWDGIHDAINKLPKHRQHWIAKHVLGECRVNTVMVKRKEKTCNKCKRCGEVETTSHVWKCRAPESLALWQQSLSKLRAHLTKTNTDPHLQAEILDGLLAWYCPSTNALPNTHLNQRQSLVGWDFIVEGWITQEWRQRQSNYLILHQQRASVHRWVSSLI